MRRLRPILEFTIRLSSDFSPGDPVVLSVQDWVVMRPYDGSRGRVFLPKGNKEPIEVVVGKKGDDGLLTPDQVQLLIQEAVAPKVGPSPDLRPDDFLRHTAEEIGVSIPRLKEAIGRWASQVEGFHEKGLVALYEGKYAEASGLMEKSVANAEGDLVQKYEDLATAYYWQQRYP